MTVTEKEASEKLCHLTIGTTKGIGKCVGSRCMAWRKIDQVGIGPNGEKRDRDMDGLTRWVDRGDCGLVAAPSLPTQQAKIIAELRAEVASLREANKTFADHAIYGAAQGQRNLTDVEDIMIRQSLIDSSVLVCELPMPSPHNEFNPELVVGRVTGKLYDGDQVPGMPGAICHACGLQDYPCVNPDCPNKASTPPPAQRGNQ